MAIYTLPPGANRLNRARGGAVFTKCANTFSIRSRRKPILKRTQRTSESRSKFASVAQVWYLLTSGNKANFAAKTHYFPRVDSIGNTYYPTAQTLQNSQNGIRAHVGEPLKQTAYTPYSPLVRSIQTFAVGLFPFSVTITMNNGNVTSGHTISIFAMPINQNRARLPFPNGHVLMRQLPAGSYGVIDFTSEYVARFGDPTKFILSALSSFSIHIALVDARGISGQSSLQDQNP